jgi:hypothetical protein
MQQAYDLCVIQDVIKLLQMRGITGRAAQAVYDFSNRGRSFETDLLPPELILFQRKMFSKPLATSPLKKPAQRLHKIPPLSSFNYRRKRKATRKRCGIL